MKHFPLFEYPTCSISKMSIQHTGFASHQFNQLAYSHPRWEAMRVHNLSHKQALNQWQNGASIHLDCEQSLFCSKIRTENERDCMRERRVEKPRAASAVTLIFRTDFRAKERETARSLRFTNTPLYTALRKISENWYSQCLDRCPVLWEIRINSC